MTTTQIDACAEFSATMSFFHVLPSNVAPDTFPDNNASKYSTPNTNPYSMKGNWDMALMNITYSSSVHTFHHDVMHVERRLSLAERLQKVGKPVEVALTLNTKNDELVKEINTKLKGLCELSFDKSRKHVNWKVLDVKLCIALSPDLKKRFNLWQDVFTAYDNMPSNYNAMEESDSWNHEKYYLIVAVIANNKTSITLKARNETIDKATFLSRCEDPQLKSIARFSFNVSGHHIIAEKFHMDDTIVIFDDKFCDMMGFRQGGLFAPGEARFQAHSFTKYFKWEWSVHIVKLEGMVKETDKTIIPIELPPRVFSRQADAIPFLNDALRQRLKDFTITFSLVKKKILKLTLTDAATSITFSDTLRDIFAFDQNCYDKPGSYSASDSFSLTRRIHYLYIYSNIGAYVRIGNTEAPLLAVIPFDSDARRTLLREKKFKNPMYVPVISEHISQIDIAIYDGAGELVPFTTDAVTSLRLHFRQV
jgi:hypothetical protein